MDAAMENDWPEANQRYLMAALGVVRQALERHIAQAEGPEDSGNASSEAADRAEEKLRRMAEALPVPSALGTVCAVFGLSPFERDLLLLCAGIEFDGSLATLCAAAQGDPRRPWPTFGLALAALTGAHWSALTPSAPLRRWRLIEVTPGETLTGSPLRIDERVLHFLAGVPHPDARLAGLVDPVAAPLDLAPSQWEVAESAAQAWAQVSSGAPLPVIQLCSEGIEERRAVAAAICASLGLSLQALDARALPTLSSEGDAIARLWEREAALGSCAMLVECDDETMEPGPTPPLRRLLEGVGGAVLVSSRERRLNLSRPLITFEVPRPSHGEQRLLWQAVLGEAADGLDSEVETLVSQFSLGPSAIQSAGREALLRQEASPEATAAPSAARLGRALWDACRIQARGHLDDLAQRIEPSAVWDDLVLPEAQKRTLREIAAHVRQRLRVCESWGFSARSARGLGISALFAGASGTGKTMAAEVLANELRLDLYRIDLSQVVSKYIGETEKNLRRVFDAAEAGGAVLLFDEADALFGRRSEVRDSHDRYANIEVSYLLQRMEAYRGLAILTSNMKEALDPAFQRRLRFIVHFPFPDAPQRAEIWRRIFPPATPTENLDVAKLARLNVTGGTIRNIALSAAFLAADAGEPVQMGHLLQAARGEYAKLEKPLGTAEIGGWG